VIGIPSAVLRDIPPQIGAVMPQRTHKNPSVQPNNLVLNWDSVQWCATINQKRALCNAKALWKTHTVAMSCRFSSMPETGMGVTVTRQETGWKTACGKMRKGMIFGAAIPDQKGV
jgi:hypothetical protein